MAPPTTSATIWVEAWQFQCCDEYFAIGSEVEWTIDTIGPNHFFAGVWSDELITPITHYEDHHGALPDGWPVTHCVVKSIRPLYCAHEPQAPGSQVMVPVPGSGTHLWLPHADGVPPDIKDRMFMGYIVEVDGEFAI